MSDAFETYQRMTDNERYAAVAYIIEQGRHLENLDEWDSEDNFQTTEDLMQVYHAVIQSHEDKGQRCDCGNTRHNDEDYDETGDEDAGPEYTAQVINPNGVHLSPSYTPLTYDGARAFLIGAAHNAAATAEDKLWIRRDLDQNNDAEWNGYQFSIIEIEREGE